MIHRDLKPENILLNDGQPLVADFGIALAVSKAGGARVTQTGLSLGTPQYMSPEQATGDRVIDGRTDIYSLGAVTYEMLAGEPPHAAATAQGVIAKLMTEDPRPLTVLRRSVPPHVDAAVRHALEKLPADRYATANDFADALQGKGGGLAGPARPGRSRSRAHLAISYSLAAIGATGAGIAWWKATHVEPPEPVHFTLALPDGQRLMSSPGASIAISPNGEMIAYSAIGSQPTMLYIRHLDDLKATGFPGIERPMELKFSPDGRWISFVGQDDRVQRVPTAGGPGVTLADSISPSGTSWTTDGGIVFAWDNAIFRVDSVGSSPRKIVSGDSRLHESDLVGPFVLPNGKDIVFGAIGPGGKQTAMVSMSGDNRTTLASSWGNVLGYRDGWLIYGSDRGTIDARRFDQRARRFSDDHAITLVEGAMWKEGSGGLEASLSETGTLAYIQGDANAFLALLDHRGVGLQQSVARGAYSSPAWSPDGKRIAVQMAGAAGAASTIWVYDVASTAFSRLTTHINAIRPAWTSDGKNVVFVDDDDGTLWSVPADASGPQELFYPRPGESRLGIREVIFSADGKYAVVRTAGGPTKDDISYIPLQGTGARQAIPLVTTPFEDDHPSLSPDGHWLAYNSDETDRFEVYVRPFPRGGGRVQVSTEGGNSPRWTPDGRIVYRAPRAFWSATISTTSGVPIVVRRDSLFADPYRRTDGSHQDYDIAHDGRFAALRGASDKVDIVVMVNWWTEALAKLRSK